MVIGDLIATAGKYMVIVNSLIYANANTNLQNGYGDTALNLGIHI